jgi:hypothetical protein
VVPNVCLQLLEFDLHVLAQFQVQRAERLVEQQQRRFEHQGLRAIATRCFCPPESWSTRLSC